LNDNEYGDYYTPQDICSGNGVISFYSGRPKYDDEEKECNFLYFLQQIDSSNKYMHDRWITSIIFSVFIIATDLGLILFGLLIFKKGK